VVPGPPTIPPPAAARESQLTLREQSKSGLVIARQQFVFLRHQRVSLRSLLKGANDAVKIAPLGSRVELHDARRTPDQNSLMWARLNTIAEQVTWHGLNLTSTDWKCIFTAGLRRARVVPNIDGDGFVQLGLHTSGLSKDEMSQLLDLIDAFAAERGIDFGDRVQRVS
jgi:NinB protein